jgi:hypothetical protein
LLRSEQAKVPIIATIPTVVDPVSDAVIKESWSLLRKGLFFVAILGCVYAYLRIKENKKKSDLKKKA